MPFRQDWFRLCRRFLVIEWFLGRQQAYISYADMFQNLGSMQLLEEMMATPNGPVFNKSHKKQEIIWHKQQINHDKQNADFLAYPSAQQVKEAWREGKRQARTKALDVK